MPSLSQRLLSTLGLCLAWPHDTGVPQPGNQESKASLQRSSQCLLGLVREQRRNKCHADAVLKQELGPVSAATSRLLAWARLLGLKMVL